MLDQALVDNLKHNTDVISADGKEVGKLHAVVVDARDDDVTHIVVNSGPHFPAPGFGAPDLINVPIEDMADAQEGRVILRVTKRRFKEMPSYVERSFSAPPPGRGAPSDRPEHHVWDVGQALVASLSGVGGIPVPRETFRRAEFERHILNDSPVWRQEPHEQIGEVERVLVDEQNDDVEALVIRRGWLFTEDVVLPVDYVTEVLDGVVRVQLSDAEIEQLEQFKPEG